MRDYLTIVALGLLGELRLVDLVLPVGHGGDVSDVGGGGGGDHNHKSQLYHNVSRSYSTMVPHPWLDPCSLTRCGGAVRQAQDR